MAASLAVLSAADKERGTLMFFFVRLLLYGQSFEIRDVWVTCHCFSLRPQRELCVKYGKSHIAVARNIE